MKKEFEEKYIKDNRTEDEKMLDIIHRNHDTVRMNRLMDQELKQNKQKKKDVLMYVVLGVALISTFIGMLIYSQKQVDSCVEAGHNENWCIKNG